MDRRRFLRSSLSAASLAAIPGSRALANSLVHTSTTVPHDIDAVTIDGDQITLSKATVQNLSDSLGGKLLLPGSPAYDQARSVLMQAYDKYPALVVQPMGAADVQHAVNFARDNSLLLAVKCGGHAAAGCALMFTSGPGDGEVIGVLEGDPLYHASLGPDEYRKLLGRHGFSVVAYVDEDPDCAGHTIWLAARGQEQNLHQNQDVERSRGLQGRRGFRLCKGQSGDDSE